MNRSTFVGCEVGSVARTCRACQCIAHNHDRVMTKTLNRLRFRLSVTLSLGVAGEIQSQCLESKGNDHTGKEDSDWDAAAVTVMRVVDASLHAATRPLERRRYVRESPGVINSFL